MGLSTCLIFISKKFMALNSKTDNGSGEFIATFQCSQNDIQFNVSEKSYSMLLNYFLVYFNTVIMSKVRH